MSFRSLLDILRESTQRYPVFGKRMVEAQALGRWESAVGPAIAKHARTIRVDQAVLMVEVDHPIWKQELLSRKNQILAILNQKLGEDGAPPVADIRFVDPLPSGYDSKAAMERRFKKADARTQKKRSPRSR